MNTLHKGTLDYTIPELADMFDMSGDSKDCKNDYEYWDKFNEWVSVRLEKEQDINNSGGVS